MMKLRILVIDEDPILCKAFVLGLSSREWRVDSVKNTTSAIEIAQKHNYDLLIVDIQVSDTQKFSMLRKIRQKSPEIRAIAISAQSCLDIHDEEFLREINGFYPKPIGLTMMKRAIRMEYKKKKSQKMD